MPDLSREEPSLSADCRTIQAELDARRVARLNVQAEVDSVRGQIGELQSDEARLAGTASEVQLEIERLESMRQGLVMGVLKSAPGVKNITLSAKGNFLGIVTIDFELDGLPEGDSTQASQIVIKENGEVIISTLRASAAGSKLLDEVSGRIKSELGVNVVVQNLILAPKSAQASE